PAGGTEENANQGATESARPASEALQVYGAAGALQEAVLPGRLPPPPGPLPLPSLPLSPALSSPRPFVPSLPPPLLPCPPLPPLPSTALTSLQEAQKRMRIKVPPRVLALHLKRFKFMEQLGRYKKLSYRVVFPLHLRLCNTVDDAPGAEAEYSLFAVIVHVGSGPNHGHYVALVKSHSHWLFFDDENVEQIDESLVQTYFGSSQDYSSNTDHGYFLFYQCMQPELLQGPGADAAAVTGGATSAAGASANAPASGSVSGISGGTGAGATGGSASATATAVEAVSAAGEC
ncbi:unnamed protein product, partial [Closterium sp. NIES-53]